MAFVTRKRIIVIVALAVVVLAVALVGGKKPVPVKLAEIKPGELRVVVNATTTSTVKSETEVTLGAQRTGRVVSLPVREGDIVKAGTLIARLDLTEESVQTESALSQSKATYEESEKNLNRIEGLFNKGMIAQQDLDVARRAYEVAKSQLRAATADAGVKLDYSVLRAPFNGVIAKKFTEVGELLLPGKQIVTIVNPDRVYVLATIDEVDVGRLRSGQPASITIDAFPGKKFEGAIRRISPIVTGGKLETRTADVWIYFNKKDNRIKPGMSADIEILITTLKNVLSVPSQCVVEREGKKQVFVVQGKSKPLRTGATGVARLKPIETGETNWSYTEITKGLNVGDYVVTTPEAEGLKDGAKVEIEENK
jgi:RND family efflux transporter MFP subunit